MAITDAVRFGVGETVRMGERVCTLAKSGTVVLQLRDRELPTAVRAELGAELSAITRGTGQRLCVGERLDLALALGADGVHLPEGSASAERVRRFLSRRGQRLWLSHAVHELDPLPGGCDAWVVAPVAAPRKGRAALGFEGLSRVVERAPAGTRVFALGGVDAESAGQCLARGASVAAIGSVYAETERLLAALEILRPSSGD